MGVVSRSAATSVIPAKAGSAFQQREALVVQWLLSGASRGDGIILRAAGCCPQPKSVFYGRFADISRADGIIDRKSVGLRQRKSFFSRRFIGVSRGDGIIPRAAGRGSQRGFSLLEILLVMALIAATGLLAAGVLTGGFDRMALRSGAKEVASQLRFARVHAIATGKPQQFLIDPAAHTWQGANGRSGELPKKLAVHFTGARELQPAEGVGAIVFFGDGASSGGRVQLSLRDAAWNVDVAWLTGEVTLRRGEVVR